jgi:hypothetical protein
LACKGRSTPRRAIFPLYVICFEASGIISEHLRYRVDSGHGGQVPDKDGDEVDGLDEGKAYSFLFGISVDSATPSYIPC